MRRATRTCPRKDSHECHLLRGHLWGDSPGVAVVRNDEFRTSDVPPGTALLVGDAAVFNINGVFCATQARCPHRQGPLSQGQLEGGTVTCPYHGAQFDVTTGAVLRGPARAPLETYRVTVAGDVGRVHGRPESVSPFSSGSA